MIIMESAIAMNNDYVECGNTLGKINLFADAAYKEYEINLKEVALKVLKENGSEDDFDFLATEAANGYIDRAKKAIAKIVEAVKKFIRKCKEKLVDLVTSAKTNAAVDKAEDCCKANSKLRSTKVEYQDTDKHVTTIKQGIDRICKKVAKVRAKGVATTDDIDEVEKIEADTMKKVAAISIVTVATLGTAIAIFKQCNSRSEIDNALDEGAVSDCDISINDDSAKTAETAAFYTKSSGLIAKLKKEIASKKVVKSTSLLDAIKKACSKSKGKLESEDLEGQAHESVLEDLVMFAYVSEAAAEEDDKTEGTSKKDESADNVEGLDLDEYFEELCDDLFTDKPASDDTDEKEEDPDDETVEESVENTEDTALTYMEQLEREVFGESEEVVEESTEDNNIDALVYMEQLEREVFGESEEVVEESTEDSNVDTDTTIESLLNEMESLL